MSLAPRRCHISVPSPAQLKCLSGIPLLHSGPLLLSDPISHPGSRTPLGMQGTKNQSISSFSRKEFCQPCSADLTLLIRMAKKLEKIWQPGEKLSEPCHRVRQEESITNTGEHGEKGGSLSLLSHKPQHPQEHWLCFFSLANSILQSTRLF